LTGGAEATIKDVPGIYAGSEHLAPIHFCEIQLAFIADALPFREKPLKMSCHGCSYFIATAPDARANCGVEMRW